MDLINNTSDSPHSLYSPI